jgi:UDP-2-acetamido-2-deoxy-ribo-hexuluronate aminotransferase
MREIRTHGQEKRYYHTRIGVGGRMDTIQCAVVLAKLERFEWEIARRMEIGRRYEVLLAERTPDLNFVRVRPNRTSVYAQYTVITTQRDRLQSELKLRGVPTAIHYPVSLHQQPAYQAYQLSSDLVNSELLASSVISLPVYPDLKAEIQERVVDYVREALSR